MKFRIIPQDAESEKWLLRNGVAELVKEYDRTLVVESVDLYNGDDDDDRVSPLVNIEVTK